MIALKISTVYLVGGETKFGSNGQACGLLNLTGCKVGDLCNVFENISLFEFEMIKFNHNT